MGTTQILPNKWQRLDDWVEWKYELESQDDIELLRTSFWEGSKGYNEFQQALEWLFYNDLNPFLVGEGMIPPELLEYFRLAEEIFGIPAWFLAAVAYVESSFNPLAENKSGAFGLFQLMPATQKNEVDKLVREHPDKLPAHMLAKYRTTQNKDAAFYKEIVSDPYINTLCGAQHLIGKGLKPSAIKWDSSSAWKEQTLPALSGYGGYGNNYEWCRKDYANKIWSNAEKFRVKKGVYPVPVQYPISTPYGKKGSMWSKGYHTGVDFAAPAGTPVYAVANAKVVTAGWHSSYGNHIKIDNGVYVFLYAHLSSMNVKAGDTVRAGQTIGRVGNTGKSTGPHLHFEMRVGGSDINPTSWLNAR